jgi:hypothetical protein
MLKHLSQQALVLAQRPGNRLRGFGIRSLELRHLLQAGLGQLNDPRARIPIVRVALGPGETEAQAVADDAVVTGGRRGPGRPQVVPALPGGAA